MPSCNTFDVECFRCPKCNAEHRFSEVRKIDVFGKRPFWKCSHCKAVLKITSHHNRGFSYGNEDYDR
jgi:hypothetical protein